MNKNQFSHIECTKNAKSFGLLTDDREVIY